MRLGQPIPKLASFYKPSFVKLGSIEGHQQPIDLAWLWFRTLHVEPVARRCGRLSRHTRIGHRGSNDAFLSEQNVKDALAGSDAHREAVDVIERVFEQQSAGTTHHLKRYTMTHPDHPGHLWHNIRIRCWPWCPGWRGRGACLFRFSRDKPVGDHLLVRLGTTCGRSAIISDCFLALLIRNPARRWRVAARPGPHRR